MKAIRRNTYIFLILISLIGVSIIMFLPREYNSPVQLNSVVKDNQAVASIEKAKTGSMTRDVYTHMEDRRGENTLKQIKNTDKESNSLRVQPTTDDLDIIKKILWRFRKEPHEEVIRLVREYLQKYYAGEDEERLFDLFSQYFYYLEELNNLLPALEGLSAREKANRIKDLRRRFFGPETARTLFSEEEKLLEYHLSHQEILNDPDLDEEEKEGLISSLKEEMSIDDGEDNSYLAYQRKLKRLKEQYNNTSSREYEEEVSALREEMFGQEAKRRLERLDEIRQQRVEARKKYLEEKKAIDEDPLLSPEQKEESVRFLRVEVFGPEEAEMVERREKIHELGLQ